jgi:hypothetical protein
MKILPKIGYVYCLWSFQFPWRYKVGWSASPDYRLAEIERSMQNEYGRTIKVNRALKMPLLFAYQFEQAIHRSFFWRPVNGMKGSGFTEWSYWINFISALLVGLLAYCNGHPRPECIAGLVLLIPLPLDYCLFIALFFCFQVGVLGGVAYLVTVLI